MRSLVALGLFVAPVFAVVGEWGQCGGINYTGDTVCDTGLVCTVLNPYYYQCLKGTATTTTTTTAPTTTATASLQALAKAKGKHFGSATDNPEFTDTPYTSLLFSSMFGAITPGNSMKWGPTNPSNGTYTYTNGDDVLNRAVAAGQIVRGHNLVWYNQLPSYVSALTDNATLQAVMTAHITNEVTHYKGKLYAWDVVNEPFSDSGGMRSWLYQTYVGTGYIAAAFKAARAADATTPLWLNEYNLEYAGSKYTTALSTVTDLVNQGVPINGVGFQGHLIVGSVPSQATIVGALNAFTALGLDVAFTELDIRMTLPATAALLAQQKADYKTIVNACLAVTRCLGITVWDYTDKYSWIPGVFSGQGAALPWDENLLPKPAYDGIVEALKA
ncbi:endo-1,4-beta-xylanase precursor [Flagelloscypha sp. PMI_526]|nr:endo-1,4-beta-xylanase precursor [Flagelloscypha sp. PMI_526]